MLPAVSLTPRFPGLRSSLVLSVASILCLVVVAPASAVPFIDDSFDGSPPYTVQSTNNDFSNPDDVSYSDGSQVLVGGNPGAAMQVEHFHEVVRDTGNLPENGDGSVALTTLFENTSALYNPLASGAILSVDFSIDLLLDQQGQEGGAFNEVFFTIGNNVSSITFLVAFMNVSVDANWQTITATGVTSPDLMLLDFAGADDLIFGFGLSSMNDITFADESFSGLADNFKVTINPVPEPSTALLVGLGLLGLQTAGRRR